MEIVSKINLNATGRCDHFMEQIDYCQLQQSSLTL